MAVYAVGDIQGCYKPLRKLLKKVKFNAAKDTLWCVGDLVNRGPDSLKTLRFLKGLGDACICVLGNHDLHLLGLAAGGEAYRSGTLKQVLDAPDCKALIKWLRHRPLLHHDPRLHWTMVHAGLHPAWTLKRAMNRAQHIEKQLRSRGWKAFCRQLQQTRFSDRKPKQGKKQARRFFSIAVMTRTRLCTSDGLFNWNGKVNRRKYRLKPWYAHKRAKWLRKTHVVYGHWAAQGLVTDQAHVLGLDSGCVWGGSLTLARLKKNGQYKIVARVNAQ